MKKLNLTTIAKWITDKYYWLPASIDISCPHCTKLANFKLANTQHLSSYLNTAGSTAVCPNCNEIIYIWIIKPYSKDLPQGCSAVLIYPSTQTSEGENINVPISSVCEWRNSSGRWYPSSIKTACPHCSYQVIFSSVNTQIDIFPRDAMINNTKCPRCDKQVLFWAVGPTLVTDKATCKEIAMFPFLSSKEVLDEKNNLVNNINQPLKEIKENFHNQNTELGTTILKSDNDNSFDIAIICALKKTELEKMKQAGNAYWDELEIEDHHIYYKTEYLSKMGSPIRIIASSPTHMGLTATAILATKITLKFRPQFLIMVGIAAGTKGKDRNFGDILVADPSFDYSSGKISKIKNSEKFEPDPFPLPIDPAIRTLLQTKQVNRDYLDKIRQAWPAKPPGSPLNLHIGPLGSGPSVLNSSEQINQIKEHWRKLIGAEMEIYSTYFAATQTIRPAPMFLSFKSVCDFAQRKTDDWQEYAAYTAAEYCYNFIVNDLWDRLGKKK